MSLEYRIKETYLALIKNSIGSKLFNDLYFFNNSNEEFEGIAPQSLTNVTQGGAHSCARFVSGLIFLMNNKNHQYIEEPHATLASTIKDLERSGWQQFGPEDGLYSGDVIVWEKNQAGANSHYAEGHGHIGFILDSKTAVSNSESKASIIAHDPEYKNMEGIEPRKIKRVFSHPDLSARFDK